MFQKMLQGGGGGKPTETLIYPKIVQAGGTASFNYNNFDQIDLTPYNYVDVSYSCTKGSGSNACIVLSYDATQMASGGLEKGTQIFRRNFGTTAVSDNITVDISGISGTQWVGLGAVQTTATARVTFRV